MKKSLVISLVWLGILQGACAKHGPDEGNLEAREASLIARNEQRIDSLENQIASLNAQIEQMNNRVYEVRAKNGQKTSMTVVPVNAASNQNINPGASNAAFQASQLGKPAVKTASPQAKPQGRIINPTTKPAPLPKNQPVSAQVKPPAAAFVAATPLGPAGSVGKPEPTAGPAGQLSASPVDNLSLPPAGLPDMAASDQPTTPVTNVGNMGSEAHTSYRANAQTNAVPPVPVPVLPDSGLSLPPETATETLQQPNQNIAPHATPAPVQAASTQAPALPKGEANAYNAALKAVRSGHTNQGIQMFREFLQQYPRGKYAANADYWIGECLYQQGKYSDALSQFNTVNSSFPTHHKNADALLKAGMSLSKLGDKAAANEKYRAILTKFPSSDAAKKVRAMGVK